MKKMPPVYIPYVEKNDHSVKWPEDAGEFPGEIVDGKVHFVMETQGVWNQIRKISALAVEKSEDGIIIHGERSLLNPTPSGYDMEGYVSISGKKFSAFTSSQMFHVKGELVDVAIFYIRRSK
jgi:hypothetical protein